MSNQTSVELSIDKATPGLVADIHGGNKIISAAVESAVIAFGIVVSRGTDANEQAVLGGDATGILGVSVRELGREAPSIGSLVSQYVLEENMAVMQEGYIYATCVDGCTAGDTPKFVNATGALGAGAAAAGETSLDNWEWMETAGAAEVAKLRVDGLRAGDLTAGS